MVSPASRSLLHHLGHSLATAGLALSLMFGIGAAIHLMAFVPVPATDVAFQLESGMSPAGVGDRYREDMSVSLSSPYRDDKLREIRQDGSMRQQTDF